MAKGTSGCFLMWPCENVQLNQMPLGQDCDYMSAALAAPPGTHSEHPTWHPSRRARNHPVESKAGRQNCLTKLLLNAPFR